MTNVEMTVKGNKLTIVVDLSQDHGKSASGKTNIVGTTSGFTTVPGTDGISIGLNVVKKAKAAQAS